MYSERNSFTSRNYSWGYLDRNDDNVQNYRALPSQILESSQYQQINWKPQSFLMPLSRSSNEDNSLSDGSLCSTPYSQTPPTSGGSAYMARSDSNIGYSNTFVNPREEVIRWPRMDQPLQPTLLYRPNGFHASEVGQHFQNFPRDYAFTQNDNRPSLLDMPLGCQTSPGMRPPPNYFTRESDDIASRIRALDDDIARTSMMLAQTRKLLAASSLPINTPSLPINAPSLPINAPSLPTDGAAYYTETQSVLTDTPLFASGERQSLVEHLKQETIANSVAVDSRCRYRLQETPRTRPDGSLAGMKRPSSVSVEQAHRFHNYAKPPYSGSDGRARNAVQKTSRRIKLNENNNYLFNESNSQASFPKKQPIRQGLVAKRRPKKRGDQTYTPAMSYVTPSSSNMSLSRGMQPFTTDNGIFITPEIYQAVTGIYKDYDLEEQGLPTFTECDYIVSLIKSIFEVVPYRPSQ